MQANDNPFITIIIPVYNYENYISECIGSVKRQSLSNIEIICIDDCSTDSSLEVLKRETSSDPRFKVIALEKNAGQGHARNVALGIAKGEYIQFLDADDFILDNCCESLYSTAKSLDLDMLMYSGMNFTEKDKPNINQYWDYQFLPKGFKSVFNYRDCDKFIELLPVSAGINFYKRELITKNEIRFPEGLYFEDTFFFMKAFFNASRVSVKNEKFYIRRMHGQSTTHNWDKHILDYVDVFYMVLEYLKSVRISDTYISAIERFNISAITLRYENLSLRRQGEVKESIKSVAAKHKIAGSIFSSVPKFGIIRHEGSFRQFRMFGATIVELRYANNQRTFIFKLLGKNIYKKTAK